MRATLANGEEFESFHAIPFMNALSVFVSHQPKLMMLFGLAQYVQN